MRTPTYGPSARTMLEVQPDMPVHTGSSQAFDQVRKAFDGANKFIKPAVIQEQTVRGEEEALAAVNGGTFEVARPFTVRDQAFNTTASKLIANKASIALDEGVRAAMKKANGNLGALNGEMEKLRNNIMGDLPEGLPGLADNLQASYERSHSAAKRQTIELAERRAIAAQKQAAADAAAIALEEVETLGLTGGTADELAAAVTQSSNNIAAFGPRGEFTVNGVTYPADPSRSGILSAREVQSRIDGIAEHGASIMLEAEFLASDAPGAFARDFEANARAGNSPFDAGTSLKMISSFNSRARTIESQRRTDQKAAENALDEAITDTFTGFVTMAEAGVPVAIPEGERQALLETLSTNPEKLAEARRKFAAADAIVETHGMTGVQLVAYHEDLMETARAAAARGEFDLTSAAQIEAISDRVQALKSAVTRETTGISSATAILNEGGLLTEDDIATLRVNAAGNDKLLKEVEELEVARRLVDATGEMSGAQREQFLEAQEAALQRLAVEGKHNGVAVAIQIEGVELAMKRSERISELASKDPVKFAAAKGIELQSLEVETMAQAGGVIVDRMKTIAPAAQLEGVENAVPLTDPEVAAIAEVFQNSTRTDQAAFLASVAELGRDGAMAVYDRIGMDDPVLFAAGIAQSNNNGPAARMILRGNGVKVGGATPTNINAARAVAIGPVMNTLTPDTIQRLDSAATAYAKGLAISEGGEDVTQEQIEAGYRIALGEDQDGRGGLDDTRFGPVILPPGVTGGQIDRALSRLTDDNLAEMVGGSVVDVQGRRFTAEQLLDTIEGLRPHPTKPGYLIATDADGGVFGVVSTEGETFNAGILEFNIEALVENDPGPGFFGRLFGAD